MSARSGPFGPVGAPWRDVEGLFPAASFLVARDGAEMARHLRAVLNDPALRADLIATGLAAIRGRHTCAHRVDEFLAVLDEIRGGETQEPELRPCA